MNLETDCHGGYQGEAVVQHVDAHAAATENVWDNGLDLCIVPDSEDVMEKSSASYGRHRREIRDGLGE